MCRVSSYFFFICALFQGRLLSIVFSLFSNNIFPSIWQNPLIGKRGSQSCLAVWAHPQVSAQVSVWVPRTCDEILVWRVLWLKAYSPPHWLNSTATQRVKVSSLTCSRTPRVLLGSSSGSRTCRTTMRQERPTNTRFLFQWFNTEDNMCGTVVRAATSQQDARGLNSKPGTFECSPRVRVVRRFG